MYLVVDSFFLTPNYFLIYKIYLSTVDKNVVLNCNHRSKLMDTGADKILRLFISYYASLLLVSPITVELMAVHKNTST